MLTPAEQWTAKWEQLTREAAQHEAADSFDTGDYRRWRIEHDRKIQIDALRAAAAQGTHLAWLDGAHNPNPAYVYRAHIEAMISDLERINSRVPPPATAAKTAANQVKRTSTTGRLANRWARFRAGIKNYLAPRKPRRLELRLVTYSEAEALLREGWTIAREEDHNGKIGWVYLEKLA